MYLKNFLKNILYRGTKQIPNIKCIFCLHSCTYVFINFLLSCAKINKQKTKKNRTKQNKTKQKSAFMAALKTAGENMYYYNFWVLSSWVFFFGLLCVALSEHLLLTYGYPSNKS